MSNPACPKCHRKGTYSEKYKQCTACGLGVTKRVTGDKPAVTVPVTQTRIVTPHVTLPPTAVTEAVTPVTNGVTACPECKRPFAKTGAERAKAYRARIEALE